MIFTTHPHLPNVDYRARCDGTGRRAPQFGNCYTTYTSSGSGLVPLLYNTTRVTDYAVDPIATGIPPYPRPNRHNPICAADPTCDVGYPFCDPWTLTGNPPPDVYGCASGSNSIGHNCYTPTSGFIDYRTCRKLGFKNVQAKKVWHGRFGFTTHDPNGCFDGQINSDPCIGVNYELPQLSPDTTKYLTINKKIIGYQVDNNDVCFNIGNIRHERTYSVNPSNGVVSLDYCLDDTTGWSFTPIIQNGWGNGPSCGSFPGIVSDAKAAQDAGSEYYEADSGVSETSYFWEVRQYGFWGCNGDPIHRQLFIKYRVEMTLSNPYTAQDVSDDVNGMLGLWKLGDDIQYPWRTDDFCTVAPLVSRNEVPYPVSPDLFGDCLLTDYSQPPDESGNYPTYPWYDTNRDIYDGAILGAPLPHGYAGYFDFGHKTYNNCITPLGDEAWYPVAYGALSQANSAGDSTDSFVPMSATQWTTNYEATFLAPYAWQSYNQVAYGVFMAQKWAEIQITRPSYNYARPCGVDRYQFQERTVRCIVGTSSGTYPQVQISTVSLGAPEINTNDAVMVCGAGDYDGGWKVSKVDAQHYDLVERIFRYPSGYIAPYDCEGGIMGRLRFNDAPALCGQVPIIDAATGAPIKLTFGEETWLLDGDKILVEGIHGNTAANGYNTVQVLSPTECLLSGTSGTSHYTYGGFATSPFGKAEKWNDVEPKGEYSILKWNFNYRDVGEYHRLLNQYNGLTGQGCSVPSGAGSPDPVRQVGAARGMDENVSAFSCETHCLPYKNCNPSVIYFSPNTGDVFTNGANHGFGNMVADERYGSRWAGQVRQSVVDPLYESPHKPCLINVESEEGDFGTIYPQHLFWIGDDGTCQADTIDPDTMLPKKYYAAAPLVESRCKIPDDAPLLPYGIYINCLTVPEANAGVSGNICNAPSIVGNEFGNNMPRTTATPWGFYLRELGCVCSDGRFKTEYEADGVACTEEVSPP